MDEFAVGVENVDPDDDLVAAGAPLHFIRSKSRSAESQVRDDVGRWRKIYYRLRRESGSDAKIQAAYKLVKDAERREALGTLDPKDKTEKVRKGLADQGLSIDVDERVSSDLLREASEAAKLSKRLLAMGPDHLVNFGSLPQDIQDALKRYMTQTDLEPRITKHFGPFRKGKVKRSVKDILNLLDRTIIDAQTYRKGYDREHS